MNIKYLIGTFPHIYRFAHRYLWTGLVHYPHLLFLFFLFLVENNIYIKYLFVKVTRSFAKVLQVACLFAKVLFYNLTSLFVKKIIIFATKTQWAFLLIQCLH